MIFDFVQIPINKNGTIPYSKFLDVFVKVSSPENLSRSASNPAPGIDVQPKYDAGDVTAAKAKTRKFVVADASKEQSGFGCSGIRFRFTSEIIEFCYCK